MPKRKRGGGLKGREPTSNSTLNPSASKLSFKTYEDIADSEDEFHIGRDEVLLDGSREAKRRRALEEEDFEPSDEEVLDLPDSEAELEDDAPLTDAEDDEGDDLDIADDTGSAKAPEDEEKDEISGWGASKADYYNADVIENEEDAAREEAEGRRLQEKRLKALRQADFGFDEQEWVDLGKTVENGLEKGDGLVTEVLPKLLITPDMSADDKLNLLRRTYPETEPLAKQLLELQPLYAELSATVAESQKVVQLHGSGSVHSTSIDVIQFRALAAYLAAIAMYFAILTSTATEGQPEALPMASSDIQHHGIMGSLLHSRQIWEQAKDLSTETYLPSLTGSDEDSAEEIDGDNADEDEAEEYMTGITSTPATTKDPSKSSRESTSKEALASLKRRAERLRRTEESLAALSQLQSTKPKTHTNRATTRNPSIHRSENSDDAASDLGDESSLPPHEVAEKARRKKSLRFYTSQIAQRANKRATAGRAAGGDDDLPYRERFRDRQIRLNKEAEKRGRTGPGRGDGTELQGDFDHDADIVETNRDRERKRGGLDGDDEVAAALESRVLAKKNAKAAREAAYDEARAAGGRVVPYVADEVGADGRRELGYQIEKNKGLTPKRKKELRNPRVKKRRKYEEKSKKLRSMKATYKGGEGRGGYGGESTGIKKGLVRSTKL